MLITFIIIFAAQTQATVSIFNNFIDFIDFYNFFILILLIKSRQQLNVVLIYLKLLFKGQTPLLLIVIARNSAHQKFFKISKIIKKLNFFYVI